MDLHNDRNRRFVLRVATAGVLFFGLFGTPWLVAGRGDAENIGEFPKAPSVSESSTVTKEVESEQAMQVFYLEIVTKEVDAVCATYAAAMGVQFGEAVAGLGNARTAAMPGGGMVGVRAPMRDTEAPLVRPYWLVDDIKAAIAAAEKAGGKVAHPPMEIPGYGTFAIYLQGGIDHGLWQR